MGRLNIGLLAALGLAAVVFATLISYRIGVSHGVQAGLATGSQVGHVAQGIWALSIIRHLEAGRHEAAIAELDAQVDGAISEHWIRTQAPSHYADIVESPVELVAHLAEYRKSRPSTARDQTPNMNRLVAEYLEDQDQP